MSLILGNGGRTWLRRRMRRDPSPAHAGSASSGVAPAFFMDEIRASLLDVLTRLDRIEARLTQAGPYPTFVDRVDLVRFGHEPVPAASADGCPADLHDTSTSLESALHPHAVESVDEPEQWLMGSAPPDPAAEIATHATAVVHEPCPDRALHAQAITAQDFVDALPDSMPAACSGPGGSRSVADLVHLWKGGTAVSAPLLDPDLSLETMVDEPPHLVWPQAACPERHAAPCGCTGTSRGACAPRAVRRSWRVLSSPHDVFSKCGDSQRVGTWQLDHITQRRAGSGQA